MIDPSDVPPELQHLIEKRELEGRRTAKRRGPIERRQLDLGPLGAAESVEDLETLDLEEKRSGKKRRNKAARRKMARRRADDQQGDS